MAVLIWVLVVTMLLGMPIAFSVGVASLAHLEFASDLPAMILPQKMFTGVDYFSLVAIPFFILAGELMAKDRITDSIIGLSQQLVGRLSGGLAHVNIISSMFFAGITGAAVADSAALGPILIPAMEKEGYPRPYAAAVTAASSVMGPIIPPSLLMILYALIDGRVSVGALFLAGCIPGVQIVENHHHETCDLRITRAPELEKCENTLLASARNNLPGLPLDPVDLLIVDQMGKNFSGSGLDPNVVEFSSSRLSLQKAFVPKTAKCRSP